MSSVAHSAPIVELAKVFTPSMPASLSFVPRSSVEGQVVRALETPGKQLVIFGHSGSGKTTLITNLVRNLGLSSVTTKCTKMSNFESIMLSAFDKLNPYYISERGAKESSSETASLEANYKLIKASLQATYTTEVTAKESRALPPQLTIERLAELCGAARCCWIVEDFHKVPASEKQKLAQAMKVFMDTAVDYPRVKLIALGAVDTAREVVQYDPEMRTRVAEINVPLFTTDELIQILEKGEALLNIRFGSLKGQIAAYASGLAAVCHQLALNICSAAGVRHTMPKETWVEHTHLQDALQSYLADASDSLKLAFNKAAKRKRERRFDNTTLILKALTSVGESGATYADLLKQIKQEVPDYPQGNLTSYLKELETPDRGEIVRHDFSSGRYYFSDPLYLAYAQCVFVPAKDTRRVSMRLLGMDFQVDPDEIKTFRIEFKDKFSSHVDEG